MVCKLPSSIRGNASDLTLGNSRIQGNCLLFEGFSLLSGDFSSHQISATPICVGHKTSRTEFARHCVRFPMADDLPLIGLLGPFVNTMANDDFSPFVYYPFFVPCFPSMTQMLFHATFPIGTAFYIQYPCVNASIDCRVANLVLTLLKG